MKSGLIRRRNKKAIAAYLQRKQEERQLSQERVKEVKEFKSRPRQEQKRIQVDLVEQASKTRVEEMWRKWEEFQQKIAVREIEEKKKLREFLASI